MTLSCSCDPVWDYWYSPSDDFVSMVVGRRKRCCSCHRLINPCDLCIRLDRYRAALSDVEEKILGYEVVLAPWYLCETCGEIYLNLEDAGYCYYAGDDLREALADYWDTTGFVPQGKDEEATK